jgi:hypothetical protein
MLGVSSSVKCLSLGRDVIQVGFLFLCALFLVALVDFSFTVTSSLVAVQQ